MSSVIGGFSLLLGLFEWNLTVVRFDSPKLTNVKKRAILLEI